MSRTAKREPREAEPLRDPKDLRARLEAFSSKPKPDLAALLFANLKRKGLEF